MLVTQLHTSLFKPAAVKSVCINVQKGNYWQKTLMHRHKGNSWMGKATLQHLRLQWDRQHKVLSSWFLPRNARSLLHIYHTLKTIAQSFLSPGASKNTLAINHLCSSSPEQTGKGFITWLGRPKSQQSRSCCRSLYWSKILQYTYSCPAHDTLFYLLSSHYCLSYKKIAVRCQCVISETSKIPHMKASSKIKWTTTISSYSCLPKFTWSHV